MSKTSTTAVVIVIAVVAILAGFGAGVFYKSAMPGQSAGGAVKTLSSRVVPSIVAYGQVTKVSGNDISLSWAGDNITVTLKSGADVFSMTNVNGKSTQQKVGLSSVQVGQKVNVTLKVLANGQIEGQSIIFFPGK